MVYTIVLIVIEIMVKITSLHNAVCYKKKKCLLLILKKWLRFLHMNIFLKQYCSQNEN